MAASAFILGLVKCEIATEKMPSFTAGNFARRQIDGRCAHFVSSKTGKVSLCGGLICMPSMGQRRGSPDSAACGHYWRDVSMRGSEPALFKAALSVQFHKQNELLNSMQMTLSRSLHSLFLLEIFLKTKLPTNSLLILILIILVLPLQRLNA